MRRKLLFVIVMILVVTTVGTALSEETKLTKKESIKKLLVLSGSADMGKQMLDQMIDSYKKTMPSVTEKFWDEFKKKASEDSLIEMIIPIYDKYFSQEDIDGLIVFYESPAGKKFVSVLPDLTKEAVKKGQEWGTKLAEDIMKELAKEGYK